MKQLIFIFFLSVLCVACQSNEDKATAFIESYISDHQNQLPVMRDFKIATTTVKEAYQVPLNDEWCWGKAIQILHIDRQAREDNNPYSSYPYLARQFRRELQDSILKFNSKSIFGWEVSQRWEYKNEYSTNVSENVRIILDKDMKKILMIESKDNPDFKSARELIIQLDELARKGEFY